MFLASIPYTVDTTWYVFTETAAFTHGVAGNGNDDTKIQDFYWQFYQKADDNIDTTMFFTRRGMSIVGNETFHNSAINSLCFSHCIEVNVDFPEAFIQIIRLDGCHKGKLMCRLNPKYTYINYILTWPRVYNISNWHQAPFLYNVSSCLIIIRVKI